MQNCKVGKICCADYLLYCTFECTILQFSGPDDGIETLKIE